VTAISTLLAQVLVVLLAARLLGAAFRRIHQPQVVGEMVAGILLGPSLLGWAAPEVSAFLFPPDALGPLNALSQIGLLLFMFLLGLHLDLGTLRSRAPAAMLISLASMVVPFGLGVLLGMYLHPDLAPPGVPLAGFALFMGAAMSVTAFPVLARIVAERGLLHTRLGTIALACAALDDVIAWCILATVVALVRAGAGPLPPWAMLAGAIIFVAAMVLVVRPLLARLAVRFSGSASRQRDALGIVLLVVLAAAWTTEALGLHALFGAFLAGGRGAAGGCDGGAAAPALLCVHRAAHARGAGAGPRPRRDPHAGDRGGGGGKVRGVGAGGAGGGDGLARVGRHRRADEHARADGVGDSERGAGDWGDLARALRHHGGDGAGEHRDDHAAARVDLPRPPRPRRNAGRVGKAAR
jgi:hypothetical protein